MSLTEAGLVVGESKRETYVSTEQIQKNIAARLARQRIQDAAFRKVTLGFSLFVLALLAAIIFSLVVGAYPVFEKSGFGFLTSREWNPVTNDFGALNAIYGTVVTSIIALLIAFPVSFGIAIFLTELCPGWLKRPLGTAIELLAAIPSIIYGMWGLFVFAPLFGQYVQPLLTKYLGGVPILGALFQGAPMGIGMLSAGIILAVMVIPFIASVMRDVFEIVPPVLKESAYGLGATTWEVVRNIVLPYTKAGVVGGTMLGLGRALGETMAVTFVIGNTPKIAASLFEPGASIASTIANEFAEAGDGGHISALIAIGLILFIITLIVLSLAKLLLLQLAKGEGART
ncbi:MAG: phosphate ABC transporter permease subunit PstC [Betaproteobacteria bacterium]|jgi:phosphate transport system permease protein|nr:phosphate ABC transporter permease subunit PstC [Betaproteobacteria bacterium]